VHALAAKSVIRELEQIGMKSRNIRNSEGWIPEYKKAVEELGLRYKLASSRTSFIAVDKATLTELEGPGFNQQDFELEKIACSLRQQQKIALAISVDLKKQGEMLDSISVEASELVPRRSHSFFKSANRDEKRRKCIRCLRRYKRLFLVLIAVIIALTLILYFSMR
jgi:hypothetical protein